MTQISTGKLSRIFQSPGASTAVSERCVTLTTRGGTLHAVADSQDVLNAWLFAICATLTSNKREV